MKFSTEELNEISKHLFSSNETVATAESVTSGYLQFLLSQMVNASEIYKGGLTAYTLQEKVNLLNVDESEAKNCDCVSPRIANEMALHVADLFKTDWGIAITGYATAVEESGYKLFAYFSFAYRNATAHSEQIELSSVDEGPDAQILYAEKIVHVFKDVFSKTRQP